MTSASLIGSEPGAKGFVRILTVPMTFIIIFNEASKRQEQNSFNYDNMTVDFNYAGFMLKDFF